MSIPKLNHMYMHTPILCLLAYIHKLVIIHITLSTSQRTNNPRVHPYNRIHHHIKHPQLHSRVHKLRHTHTHIIYTHSRNDISTLTSLHQLWFNTIHINFNKHLVKIPKHIISYHINRLPTPTLIQYYSHQF